MGKQNLTGEYGPYPYRLPEGEIGEYADINMSELSKARYYFLDEIAAIQENLVTKGGHGDCIWNVV